MSDRDFSAKVKLELFHEGREIQLAQIGDKLAITRDDDHGLHVRDQCELHILIGDSGTVEKVWVRQVDGRHVWLESPGVGWL